MIDDGDRRVNCDNDNDDNYDGVRIYGDQNNLN